jgi:hypothetical protein
VLGKWHDADTFASSIQISNPLVCIVFDHPDKLVSLTAQDTARVLQRSGADCGYGVGCRVERRVGRVCGCG